MSHQTFLNDQAGTSLELGFGISLRGINALDLDHLHLHGAVFIHIDFRAGIEQALAGPVTGAVVLLDIFDLGAFADKEAVDTVMLGILCAAVVDAAAGDNDNITVLTDVKVVIHDFLEAALAHDDRDMDALVLGPGLDLDIDARAVFFRNDIYVRSGISHGRLAVGTDVEGSAGDTVKIRNLFEKPFLDFIYLFNLKHFVFSIILYSLSCMHGILPVIFWN